jgi:hypothetical protein
MDRLDRRTTRRYNLSLPITIRVPVEELSASLNGTTRDISTRGVYFILDNDLDPGENLDFSVTLPAEMTGGTEVFVRATGTVVRVDKLPENGTGHVGVAAVIGPYDIVRNASTS